jgi:ankyrin repeat protein
MELADIISKCQFASIGNAEGIDMLAACKEFGKIQMMRTPKDKIDCLVSTIDILSSSFGISTVLNTDILLPLLISCIIKSNVPNLRSNLEYINGFSFEQNIESGKTGYILSTFEAVLEYITLNYRQLIKNSQQIEYLVQSIHQHEKSIFIEAKNEHRIWKRIVQYTNIAGRNLLGIACVTRNLEMLQFLMHLGFKHDHLDGDGNNLLHVALKCNFFEGIRFLLDFDIPLWKNNKAGLTFFELALIHGDLELIDYIQEKKNSEFSTHFNPRMLKSVQDNLTLRHVISKPICDFVIDFPLLLYYTKEKKPDLAISLLQFKRPDIHLSTVDRFGKTFLHYAVEYDFEELVVLFCDLHNDTKLKNLLNISSSSGETPLVIAIRKNNIRLVHLLLEKGASLTLKMLGPVGVMNSEARQIVLETMLRNRRDWGGPRALISTSSNTGSELTLEIRSLKADEVLITTRTLHDFAFLRSQITLEHPESCLPEIRDIIVHASLLTSAPTGGREENSLIRVLKRLGILKLN